MRLVLYVLALALALSACSDESPPKSLDLDTPSPTASTGAAEPSESPTGSTDEEELTAADFDDSGHEVIASEVRAKGPAQQVVADAWLAYWQVRIDAFHAVELDATRLGEVATGRAADQVISYVGYLEQKKLNTVGDLLVGIDRIRLTGTTATLRSCIRNAGTDRRPDGSPAEPLTPFYLVEGELTRVGSDWRVSGVAASASGPC